MVAMVMIMGLALMVYSIAERKLREALKKADETLPDHLKPIHAKILSLLGCDAHANMNPYSLLLR
ncbi:MAG: hypothetical protein ACXQTS_06960 [Candidatus Methanospirareceae archaeon]